MTRYEYKVLPAPARGMKAKGAKTTEARFAVALMTLMNEQGREGWEYQRTDTLPCEERVGLTGRATRFQNMLVFRRELREPPAEAAERPKSLPAPARERAEAEGNAAEPERARAGAAESPAPGPDTEAGTGAPPEDMPRRDSVARRLAATLSSRARAGVAPPVQVASEPGAAPALGSARGNGLGRPAGGAAVE